MAQSRLLAVQVWQKKSFEASGRIKDRLISAVNKGFDAMAAVLSKDSDPEEVQCALEYLTVESSLALKFDKARDDTLRDLVYGLLESLHGSLNEWNEERNQRKEMGEISQTDGKVTRDSMGEDMRLEDVENTGMGDTVTDSLNEQPFEEDDSLRTIQPSDVMEYLMNFNYKILGDRDSPLTERNSLNEISMSIEDVVETVDSQIIGEYRGLPANYQIDYDGEEDDPIDTTKDTSDYVKNEKRRRSSRQSSKPVQYTESMEDSDGDVGQSVQKSLSDSTAKDDDVNEISDGEDDGPSMKASRSESSRKKRKSSKGEEESEDVVKKRRESRKNETELECPECEYRSPSVIAWLAHLRLKHSTTPALAGLALLCECGNESVSDGHVRTTHHSKTTVIRKRDGPIRRLDDEKATPQCVLCEIYPKTARGYATHLVRHHQSTLMQNGVYLKCSCGLEVRSSNNWEHDDDCNPRQFTLH